MHTQISADDAALMRAARDPQTTITAGTPSWAVNTVTDRDGSAMHYGPDVSATLTSGTVKHQLVDAGDGLRTFLKIELEDDTFTETEIGTLIERLQFIRERMSGPIA